MSAYSRYSLSQCLQLILRLWFTRCRRGAAQIFDRRHMAAAFRWTHPSWPAGRLQWCRAVDQTHTLQKETCFFCQRDRRSTPVCRGTTHKATDRRRLARHWDWKRGETQSLSVQMWGKETNCQNLTADSIIILSCCFGSGTAILERFFTISPNRIPKRQRHLFSPLFKVLRYASNQSKLSLCASELH